jgi:hypothetical protein
VDADVHAVPAGVDQPSLDLDEVADTQWLVEPDAAGVHGDVGRVARPLGDEDVCRLVDPAHDDAAVHLAAPVDVGRRGEEPQDDPGRGARVGVGLLGHGRGDLRPQLDAADRGLLLGLVLLVTVGQLTDGGRAAVVVDGDEDHEALGGGFQPTPAR